MSESRPNVNVIYQTVNQPQQWTCSEVVLSVIVLGGMAWAVTGNGAREWISMAWALLW